MFTGVTELFILHFSRVLGGVSVEGVPVVGYELNATKLEPSGASVDYQWQSITEENGEYTDIDSATNETYTVTEGDLWVRVKVTAKSGSNYRGTKYSTPVEIVDYFVTPKTGSAIKGNETITVYAPGADDLRIMLWAKELAGVDAAKAAYYDDERVFSARTEDLRDFITNEDGVFTITINATLIEALEAGTRYESSASGTGKYTWNSGDATTWIITPEDNGTLREEYNTWEGGKVDDTLFVYTLDAGEMKALAAVNDYLREYSYEDHYSEAPGKLESHLATLGLDVAAGSAYAKLQIEGGTNRKTAVFYDLSHVDNIGDGYTVASLKETFNSIVMVRTATQESTDAVNSAVAKGQLGDLGYIETLQAAFEAAIHTTHSDKSFEEKKQELTDLLAKYDLLDDNEKATVRTKIIDKGFLSALKNADGSFKRSQYSIDALAEALKEYITTVNGSQGLTTALDDNKIKVIIVNGTIENADTITIVNPITLVGINKATIKGCIEIKTDDVTIEGLKITGAKNDASTPTIKVSNQSGIKLINNEITGKGNGIYVTKVSKDGTIEITSNKITVGMTGIAIGSCNVAATVTITDNILENNGKHGLSLGKVENYELIITDNTFKGNKTSHYSDRNFESEPGDEIPEKITQFESTNKIIGDWHLEWSTDGSGIYKNRVLLVSGEAEGENENGDEDDNSGDTDPEDENNGNSDDNGVNGGDDGRVVN